MSNAASGQLTFALLDKRMGIAELPVTTGEEYPLPAWYRAVRDVPLNELGTEDICKACRQRIHIEHVVPLALRRLGADPLAGEMYDGELLISLRSIPAEHWSQHEAERLALMSALQQALQRAEKSSDVHQDAEEFLKTLSSTRPR